MREDMMRKVILEERLRERENKGRLFKEKLLENKRNPSLTATSTASTTGGKYFPKVCGSSRSCMIQGFLVEEICSNEMNTNFKLIFSCFVIVTLICILAMAGVAV